MRPPLAHLVQTDIIWESPAANLAQVDALLADAPVEPGDLVVLPEMFDTGFSLDIVKTADTAGRTMAYLTELASRLGVTVHGARTVFARDRRRGLNRAEIVGPDGSSLAAYDKIHPFSYGREQERFVGGTRVLTYRWAFSAAAGEGGRGTDGSAALPASRGEEALTVCPAICYDLRFPELFRTGLDLGAEAFVFGANWPEVRADHWRALSIARAIENQAFVLAANRTGQDPKLAYAGGTIGVDPRGNVLGELGREAGVLSVPVDPALVRGWRAEFPAWRDRAAVLRVVPSAIR